MEETRGNTPNLPTPAGARGAVKFATRWGGLPVRAAVVLRRGDQLRKKLAIRNWIYARILIGKTLSQPPTGLAATLPDPTILILDQNNALHLVELKEGLASIKTGEELRSWGAGSASVTRRPGRFYHEIIEIDDGSDPVVLVVSSKGRARRQALEIIEAAQ